MPWGLVVAVLGMMLRGLTGKKMNEYGEEKMVAEKVDRIRADVDKNGDGVINPRELMEALAAVKKLKAEKEVKAEIHKKILKESLSQGALMTMAVLIGSALYSVLLLFI